MKKGNLKIIFFYVLIIGLIIFALAMLFNQPKEEVLPEYGDVIEHFRNDTVKSFTVDDKDYITMQVYEGELEYDEDGKIINSTKEIGYQLQSLDLFVNDCSEYYKNNQNIEQFEIQPAKVIPWWVSLLPYAVVIIIFIVLWAVIMKQGAGGGAGKMNSFGKARVKTPQNDKNKVLFSDVAGADEEKEELQEVVEFLKAPDKFTKLGAKIPHGVLLVALPVRVRPCSQRLLQVKQAFPSSLSRARISLRCTLVSALRVFATCSRTREKLPPRSYLSTRLMRLVVTEAQVSAAVMMKESKLSTSFSLRWTVSVHMRAS